MVAKDFSHPNVVRIYQFGMDGEIAYIVLDMFHGLNLKQGTCGELFGYGISEPNLAQIQRRTIPTKRP